MIRRYEKDYGQRYRNVLEIILLFLITEYQEILIRLGIFNPITTEYETRKHWWFILSVGSVVGFISTILVTCIAVLTYIATRM